PEQPRGRTTRLRAQGGGAGLRQQHRGQEGPEADLSGGRLGGLRRVPAAGGRQFGAFAAPSRTGRRGGPSGAGIRRVVGGSRGRAKPRLPAVIDRSRLRRAPPAIRGDSVSEGSPGRRRPSRLGLLPTHARAVSSRIGWAGPV
ncbi:hypothetical protein CEE94_12025, partial [Lactobacillus crispatus]